MGSLLCFIVCSLFGCAHGMWKFLGQGSKLSHSNDDAKSLTSRPPENSICGFYGTANHLATGIDRWLQMNQLGHLLLGPDAWEEMHMLWKWVDGFGECPLDQPWFSPSWGQLVQQQPHHWDLLRILSNTSIFQLKLLSVGFCGLPPKNLNWYIHTIFPCHSYHHHCIKEHFFRSSWWERYRELIINTISNLCTGASYPCHAFFNSSYKNPDAHKADIEKRT